jgi:hypothetical protein
VQQKAERSGNVPDLCIDTRSHSTPMIHSNPLRTYLALQVAAAIALAATAQAQTCPQFAYHEAWVDPNYGSDLTGSIDNASLPYGTLNEAIRDLWSHADLAAGTHQGIVHGLPGLYSTAGTPGINAQTFPIEMKEGVHIQGTGAKECVLRVGESEGNTTVFWPLATGIVGQARDVAVDYSVSYISSGLDHGSTAELFDGFTIQGADIQVYAETEISALGRVSNCVFDMRNGGDEELAGPSFGFLTVSIWFGDNGIQYPPNSFHILNNTFVQGWKWGPGTESVDLALPQNVAICDVNVPDPPTGTFVDPNPLQRGVGNHSIQNNVIRCLPSPVFRRTSFLGVDTGDTSVVGGANTNAFGLGLAGGLDLTGTFSSAIGPAGLGTPPAPRVNTLVNDPAFVGEMIASRHSVRSRDFRLLPSSPLRDVGVAPTPQPGCASTLTAANLTAHTEYAGPLSGETWRPATFDFDGEVHGNRRVIGSTVDIGMDEIDVFVVAECYGNDTKSHNLPWDPTITPAIPTGVPQRSMIFPTSGTALIGLFAFTFTPGFAWDSGPDPLTHPPGTVALPTVFVPGWPATYMFPSLIQTVTVNPATWTNWIDGSLESFGEQRITVVEGGAYYFNEQAYFAPTSGAPVMSNLQFEYH